MTRLHIPAVPAPHSPDVAAGRRLGATGRPDAVVPLRLCQFLVERLQLIDAVLEFVCHFAQLFHRADILHVDTVLQRKDTHTCHLLTGCHRQETG